MIIFGSILAIIMIALAFQDYRTFRKKEIPHEDYKSSIIGIGIFGTFFGIIAGLWDFDNSSTAAIERSVPLLLEGLKTAFLTSLFGMGLTTFLGIIQKKGEVQKDSSETDLVLKSLFEMSENMKASQKMVSQGFQDLQDVISTNGRNLSENMENLQKGISKSNQNLQNIVSENGKNLSENMKAGQKMISQGFQDLQNGISKSNQELQNGILESNQNLQNRISEKLNILGNIHKTQEDMSKQVFSINAYSTHLENLDNNVSELTKMILQNAMKLKINENSEYWTKIFNEMATVSEELEIYKKRVLELEEKLKKSEELLLEIQNSSGQNVSELQNRVSELQNQLDKLKNEKESLVSEKEKMVSELLEKIEKLEDEIEKCKTLKQVDSNENFATMLDNYLGKEEPGNFSDDPDTVITFEDNIDVWKDRETGLFWEVKKRENIEHYYVWSREDIANADYPERNTDDVKDAFSYAEKLNSENYGGFSDWRVPTIEELKTLLGKRADQVGFGDYNLYIKKPLILTTHIWYWSSTEHNSNSSYSWLVSFYNGSDHDYYQTGSYYVRCVR